MLLAGGRRDGVDSAGAALSAAGMSVLVLTLARMSYQVTIMLPRSPRDGPWCRRTLRCPAEAAVAADALMTALTSATELLSMVIGSAPRADALSAGWAVARALGGADGATVEAQPVSAR